MKDREQIIAIEKVIKDYTHFITDENGNKWKVVEVSDLEDIITSEPEQGGEKELIDGNADSICYGRPFIGNPDLPERIRNGISWVEANTATFYSQGAEGYTTYPEATS